MPPFACSRCGRAFARAEYLALHVGRAHADLTAEERATFDAAVADEEAWLAAFRRYVRAGMNASPIALVFLGIVLLIGLSGLPIVWAFLLAPGTVGFGALVYYISYSRPST